MDEKRDAGIPFFDVFLFNRNAHLPTYADLYVRRIATEGAGEGEEGIFV